MKLFNLSNDIGEQNDVATKNPEVVKQIESLFQNARTSSEVFTFSQETFLNVD